MYLIKNSSASMTQCVLSGNKATRVCWWRALDGWNGVVGLYSSLACEWDDLCAQSGGAMYIREDSSASMEECVLSSNVASYVCWSH